MTEQTNACHIKTRSTPVFSPQLGRWTVGHLGPVCYRVGGLLLWGVHVQLQPGPPVYPSQPAAFTQVDGSYHLGVLTAKWGYFRITFIVVQYVEPCQPSCKNTKTESRRYKYFRRNGLTSYLEYEFAIGFTNNNCWVMAELVFCYNSMTKVPSVATAVHASASVALLFFLFEQWECGIYWWILAICRSVHTHGCVPPKLFLP